MVGWSLVSPRLPSAFRTPAQAAAGSMLALTAATPLGFRPPLVWAGLRLGSVSAALVTATIAATTPVPKVRLSMSARELPESVPGWLAWQIPVGTVWAEEAAFRGALGDVAAKAFGPTRGRLLQAGAFGLSHIADARMVGEPLLPVVVVTGLAGWVFGWLAERSGSLVAPILVHLAINEAGAIAAVVVQRRTWNSSHDARSAA
ncbi:MAG: CPBP family intramembrane metalloprotease [Mycobacterium sp.]|nr:MAG: CPBP family intramembrane metalloprotease [Mycobacterium sp.]